MTAIVQQDAQCEMCGKRLKAPGNAKLILFGYMGYYYCQSDYKKVLKFAGIGKGHKQ